MLLFIEGYPYTLNHKVKTNLSIKDILEGIVSFPKMEKIQSFYYVGYCYSKKAKDVVFFLPKVILTGDIDKDNQADTIFGASPLEIIDFEGQYIKEKFTEEGCKEYKDFLSNLSIWIYRTISVYQKNHNDNILESREHQKESSGRKQKHNTLLDVIIALRDFNKNNQDYFTFIAKNLHSGQNKIQWTKTITHSQAIIQKGKPFYTSPINKKKVINFDEELLIIYFSILNYIRQTHGFSFKINIQYPLINPDKLQRLYIGKNMGCRKLKQLKYKYFSDKALHIWDLCYAFFDREYKIAMNQFETDYLLTKDFAHIFEVMIDTLVGGNDKRNLPKELLEQKDGKLVDHMFIGHGLIEQSDLTEELTYYIGDSKYYKRTKNDTIHLGDNSIYKQYTYAKNVIQWNMNLFLDGDTKGQPQLRDTLTEGYNPIPNFFISARIPNKRNGGEKFLSFDEGKLNSQESGIQLNRQYENRLFDRDTLLLCHYDVNFLFIVSLYGRDNKSQQSKWRAYVRDEFRSRIQATLNTLYDFHIIQPRKGMDCYQYIKDNFHLLNGKLYRPRANSNYLIVALMKEENKDFWNKLKIRTEVIENEIKDNKSLLNSLQSHFHISPPFNLNTDIDIPQIDAIGTLSPPLKQKRNVLTGLVRKTDDNFEIFVNHQATSYIMEKIPTIINLMNIEYFLPMIAGNIDGYYKVEKVYFLFPKDNEIPNLKLKLSTYIPLGDKKIQIYRIKMQPGELISEEDMKRLYE